MFDTGSKTGIDAENLCVAAQQQPGRRRQQNDSQRNFGNDQAVAHLPVSFAKVVALQSAQRHGRKRDAPRAGDDGHRDVSKRAIERATRGPQSGFVRWTHQLKASGAKLDA